MVDERLAKLSKIPPLLDRYDARVAAFVQATDRDAAYATLLDCVAELSVLFTPDLTDLAYEFGEFVIAHSRFATAVQQPRSPGRADAPIPEAALTKVKLASTGLSRAVQRLIKYDLTLR